jgi:hypothetical protein
MNERSIKDLEGSGRGLFEILWYYDGISMEGSRETTKTSARIASIPTEIWTEHLLNTKLKRYRYANLLASVQWWDDELSNESERIWKEAAVKCCMALRQNFPAQAKTKTKAGRNSQSPNRYLNQGLPEYEGTNYGLQHVSPCISVDKY